MDSTELTALLHQVYLENDEMLRDRFKRSLSFEDGLNDRWERAKRLGFGEGASIYQSALVYGDVEVGEKTWIGPSTILDGSGGKLRIGSFCSVSAAVHVYTHDTVLWALSGGRLPHRTGAVEIGDNCYIGSQAIIAAGTRVGTRCVIAANSFVNRDVPDDTVVGGSPAKPIGRVEGAGPGVRIVWNHG